MSTSYFTRMKNFGKCAKKPEKPGPLVMNHRASAKKGRQLPAQLESELELPRVIGCRGLTGETSFASSGVAKLVDRRDIGAVKQIETIGNEIELQPFAEGNLLG
jgi:hypothetical protein